MKKTVAVSFNEGRKKYDSVLSLLRRVGCEEGLTGKDHVLCGLYHWTFDESDERWAQLRTALTEAGISWQERWNAVYSEDELLSADFLTLLMDRKPIESGGAEFGTTYDDSAGCPRCGTGARQTSALMIRPSELPRRGHLCSTCEGYVLAGQKLADAMRTAGMSGAELRQAQAYPSGEPLPWWQIIPTHTLPKMSRHTRGIVRDTDAGWGCPACQRDMFAGTTREPAEIVYDRCEVDTRGLPDVVQTWECFGRSVLKDDPERQLVRGFAQPLIMVRPSVMRLLRRMRVCAASFEPVRFVD